MPIYKATIEVHVDGDDVSWLNNVLSEIRDMDGVSIASVAPFSNNPPNYPDEEELERDFDIGGEG